MKAKKLSAPRKAATLPEETTVHRIRGDAGFAGSGFGGGFGHGFGPGQGHNGADYSIARGYVYFPQLDTRKEINEFTRTEILRKVRYLYANVGFARRLVNGISRMVAGTGLLPRPKTTDKDWNKLALKRIMATFGSASTYDISGRFNGFRAQRAKLRCRYKDGDMATVFTRGLDGRACIAMYEGHQIGSGKLNPGEEKTVFDGVRMDHFNRMQALRLLNLDGAGFTEVPAQSVSLLADYERLGQPRGLSILSHCVNHLLDKTEIDSYFKGSIKNAARIGYYIGGAKDTVSAPLPRPGGSSGNRRTIDLGSGRKVNLDTVYGNTGGEVPELDPGQEIKMLLDQRPHPNTLEFAEYLIRDAALGVDLSPEVLWSIVKLGGTNIRYVMADAQGFIEQEQQTLVNVNLGPEYMYFLVDEITSGRLPPCPDPEWWQHDWITPARTTVDVGRDGKLYLDQLRSCALTFRRFYGWQGLGLEELDEWLDEYKYIQDGAVARGLDPVAVLAAIYSRPGVGQAVAADQTTADNPDGQTADPAAEKVDNNPNGT